MKRCPVYPGQVLSVTLFATLGAYLTAGTQITAAAIPFLMYWLAGWLLLFVRELLIVLKLPPYNRL